MKVLLSAYACEPGKGSEPLVGWRWAQELAKLGISVWVLTRRNNRAVIEASLAHQPMPGVQFLYCDIGLLAGRFKRLPFGIHAYYYFWQIAAFFVARSAHKEHRFDRVHHVTFGTQRFPSFMGFLGIPAFMGPVGGGERSATVLRAPLGFGFWLTETLRGLLFTLIRLDPIRALAMSRMERIYITSEESRHALPFWLRDQAIVHPHIASDGPTDQPVQPQSDRIELLYAGLWKDWKGLRLGMRALKIARQKGSRPYRLVVVGKGPDEERWRAEATRLGLDDIIRFEGWVPRAQMLKLYAGRDAFLYPSTHDSGGFVVLEAMEKGVPVICLDCGGPGLSVVPSAGHAEPVVGRSYEQIVEGLAEALLALQDEEQRDRWRAGARRRAQELTWKNHVAIVYGPLLSDRD